MNCRNMFFDNVRSIVSFSDEYDFFMVVEMIYYECVTISIVTSIILCGFPQNASIFCVQIYEKKSRLQVFFSVFPGNAYFVKDGVVIRYWFIN